MRIVPAWGVVVAALSLLGSTVLAACPATVSLDFPPMCADEPTSASARICFGAACELGGIVNRVDPPKDPFEVIGYHVDGDGGSEPVSESDFPLELLPGESLVADLRITLANAGKAQGKLTWRVANAEDADEEDDEGEGDDKEKKKKKPGKAEDCPVVLRAEVPRCAAVDPKQSCLGAQACVAGVCVPAPLTGSCDDGDPCTVGDTCVAGRCVPGTARNCDDHVACTRDRCTAGVGCVHTPVDSLCGGAGTCRAAVCDPTAGCRTRPLTGSACDDGESCTTNDACVAGRCVGKAKGCDDHLACTEDSCAGGKCTHVPVDVRCDRGQCVVAACRPGSPGTDGEGCVGTPSEEGTPCTGDGVACTDDVCTGGVCLHVPIDSRCGVGDACTQAVCTPDGPDRDEDGCATSAQSGGCPEDGDPCSDDHCQEDRCLHERIAEWVTCSPVRPAYQKALALSAAARGLQAQVESDMKSMTTAPSMASTLSRLAIELDAVVQVLAGKSDDIDLTTPSPAFATPAQIRARVALGHVVTAPHRLRRVLQAVSAPRLRSTLGKDAARIVRRRVRVLLSGLKALKRDLKRLQIVSQTLAR